MNSVFKIQFGDDIRLASLQMQPSYEMLQALFIATFNPLSGQPFNITYKDQEGDWIRIATDLDTSEAFKMAKELGSTYKLRLIALVPSQPTTKLPSLRSDFVMEQQPSKDIKPSAIVTYPKIVDAEDEMISSFAQLASSSPNPNPAEDENSSSSGSVDIQSKGAEQKSIEEKIEAISAQADKAVESKDGLNVLETLEQKLRTAYDALVQFIDSLSLPEKINHLKAEVEPTLQQRVVIPFTQVGKIISTDFNREVERIRVEINSFKSKIETKLEQLGKYIDETRTNMAAPNHRQEEEVVAISEVPVPAPVVVSAPPQIPPKPQQPPVVDAPPFEAEKNVMSDVAQLEAMGFTDRRRNLELLAKYQGRLDLVVDTLLK